MTYVVLLLVVLAAGGIFVWWGGLFTTRRLERKLVVDNAPRKYIAWLPVARKRRSQLPVVLAFHAAFGSAEGFEENTALHEAKEAEHFIIVYPEGHKRTWNAGDCCGPAHREKINDRKFIQALLDDLASVVPIDRRRVYATGFSNGGRICYFLAGTMSEVITAIAPMGTAVLTDHVPVRPIPILHIHGLSDKWAPYYGGASAWKSMPVAEPTEKGLEFWRNLAGTSTESRGSLFDGNDDCITYAGAPDGTKIELCRIPGLGHNWPGTRMSDKYRQFMVHFGLGPVGPPIDVRDTVLRFFREFAIAGEPARKAGPAAARGPRTAAAEPR